MKQVVSALSVLIFLVGSLLITGAALAVWAFLMVKTAQTFGAGLGWAMMIGTFVAIAWWPAIVQAPWAFWFSLWRQIDADLRNRLDHSGQ